MGVLSMTGCGRGVAVGGGYRVDVELSSVNRRQLDIIVNLPREFAALEPLIQEFLQRSIQRGRVTVRVDVQRSGHARRAAVQVDEPLAAAYAQALRRAGRRLGLAGDLEVGMLLNLPGVVRFVAPADETGSIAPVLERALVRALRGLLAMRTREGATLRRDLEKRLGRLRRLRIQIEKRAPQAIAHHRRALRERLRQAGVSVENDDRLVRELALFADRLDISEELVRLLSHLQQADTLLRAKDAVGRPMDFLVQELFREINTIGSKAGDAAITRHVVDFKAELERLREQVQNVE